MENGLVIKEREKANKLGQMVLIMTVNGKKIELLDKEFFTMWMEMFTMENG